MAKTDSNLKDSPDAKVGVPTDNVGKVKKKVIKKKTTGKEVKPRKAQAKAKSEKVEKPSKETVETPVQPDIELNEGETTEAETDKKLAKAGKHSAKAIKEAQEKEAKEARKSESKEAQSHEKPKPSVKPAKSKLERRSKGYRKAAEQVEKDNLYSVKDAVALAAKTSPVKFDATIEMHVRLGVDPKIADHNIRDTVVLPAGSGKKVRVAVFASPAEAETAKKAGADIAAAEEFLDTLDKGEFNFDVLIATPAMMAKLAKYARVLGPKGLMPNPKSGTVTTDVAKAVKELKTGRLEYRVDGTGIIHVGIGKASFGPEKLLDNAKVILASIKSNKPSSLKGNYILSIFATSTMGPSIPVDLSDTNSL